MQEGEDDEDITANDTSTPSPPVIAGIITHARARQLNHQVSSLLSSCSSYLDCGDPCTLVLLRNQGEDREGKGLARVGFGLQKSIDCDGRHGRIWTQIGVFKYLMESLSSLLSNGSDLTSISVRSRPQSSIVYRDVFCPQCCVIVFWPNGPCIKLSPLWMRPRVGARPQHPCGRPPKFLYPLAAAKNTWVLFRSSLAFATCL